MQKHRRLTCPHPGAVHWKGLSSLILRDSWNISLERKPGWKDIKTPKACHNLMCCSMYYVGHTRWRALNFVLDAIGEIMVLSICAVNKAPPPHPTPPSKIFFTHSQNLNGSENTLNNNTTECTCTPNNTDTWNLGQSTWEMGVCECCLHLCANNKKKKKLHPRVPLLWAKVADERVQQKKKNLICSLSCRSQGSLIEQPGQEGAPATWNVITFGR